MIKRRQFIQTSFAALAATQIAPGNALAQSAPATANAPQPGQPLVTAPTPDGVTIVWAVDAPSTGWVEFGETTGLGLIAYGAVGGLRPFDEHVISIPLRGLRAGSKVYYRTVTASVSFPNQYKMSRGEPVASPTYFFTLPGLGDTAKIAVWNDTHQQAGTLRAVQKLTDDFAPSLLVWNGDVVADQFMQERDFTAAFLRHGNGIDPASSRPMLYSRGNHDVRGAVARLLPHYMPRPLDNGFQNVLRVGPIGVLVLDTGEDKEGPQYYGDLGEFAHYREAQRIWLESAVQIPQFKDAPHKVLFCHIPLRWLEKEDQTKWCADGDNRWSAVLARAGVKAVISGHTHLFWHDAPTDMRPFHQITGGGPQTKVTQWSPTPATVIKLEADSRRLSIEVVEAESRASLLSLKMEA